MLKFGLQAVSSLMFSSQMEFFAKLSADNPAFGGTYMTLLNTLANVGAKWPPSLALWGLGYLQGSGGDPLRLELPAPGWDAKVAAPSTVLRAAVHPKTDFGKYYRAPSSRVGLRTGWRSPPREASGSWAFPRSYDALR